MEESTQFRINTPKVIHETIDGETVIVNLDTGNYYSLNRVGADIWSLIGIGITVHHIVEDIACRYAGERQAIGPSVLQFINELREEALIITDSSQMNETKAKPVTRNCAEQITEKLVFETPLLQKYSDMQDLLLLDPIHEVDDAGWPNAKTADT